MEAKILRPTYRFKENFKDLSRDELEWLLERTLTVWTSEREEQEQEETRKKEASNSRNWLLTYYGIACSIGIVYELWPTWTPFLETAILRVYWGVFCGAV